MPAVAGRRLLGVGLLCLGAVAGCGGDRARGTAGGRVEPLAIELPERIGELEVAAEDVSAKLATVQDTYLRQSAVYSLRKGDQVVGTLQVSRFDAQARVEEEEFRNGFVSQLAGRTGTPTRVGSTVVQLTTGGRKQLAVWFRERDVYVLTVRDDYERPRALLRSVVDIGAAA